MIKEIKQILLKLIQIKDYIERENDNLNELPKIEKPEKEPSMNLIFIFWDQKIGEKQMLIAGFFHF